MLLRCLRDFSVVKNVYWFSSGHGIDSQNPGGSSQLSVTPALGYPVSSSSTVFCKHWMHVVHRHVCCENVNTQITNRWCKQEKWSSPGRSTSIGYKYQKVNPENIYIWLTLHTCLYLRMHVCIYICQRVKRIDK